MLTDCNIVSIEHGNCATRTSECACSGPPRTLATRAFRCTCRQVWVWSSWRAVVQPRSLASDVCRWTQAVAELSLWSIRRACRLLALVTSCLGMNAWSNSAPGAAHSAAQPYQYRGSRQCWLGTLGLRRRFAGWVVHGQSFAEGRWHRHWPVGAVAALQAAATSTLLFTEANTNCGAERSSQASHRVSRRHGVPSGGCCQELARHDALRHAGTNRGPCYFAAPCDMNASQASRKRELGVATGAAVFDVPLPAHLALGVQGSAVARSHTRRVASAH